MSRLDYRGYFTTLFELVEKHPTANCDSFAYVEETESFWGFYTDENLWIEDYKY